MSQALHKFHVLIILLNLALVAREPVTSLWVRVLTGRAQLRAGSSAAEQAAQTSSAAATVAARGLLPV